MPMLASDIIIKADYVLTMDPALSVIERGAVVVRAGKIVAAGPEDEVCRLHSAPRIIGGRGYVAFPGLVNTHTHSPMVYFRGLQDDLPLKVWLEEHIWPAEDKWLSREFVRDATGLACLEMLKAGITLFSDMYFFGDEIAETTREIGMRAIVGAGIIDFPGKTGSGPEEYLANAGVFIEKWLGDRLIIPAVAPHSPYTCSPDTLKKAREMADRHGSPLHVHLSETEWEVAELLKRYGKTPIAHLDGLGLLDEKVVAAHCVWPTEEEIGMLAERGVGVSHCIESNLKLASGIAPVVRMLEAGVKVTFGTDGAAGNNDLDILSELSTAAKVHKAVTKDPTVINARQALLMATRWGAEALGLGGITGSIEAGKAADIVLADLKRPHLLPLYDIHSHIVYSMNSADINSVMVDGRLLIDDRKPTTADQDAILARASEWGRKISADRRR